MGSTSVQKHPSLFTQADALSGSRPLKKNQATPATSPPDARRRQHVRSVGVEASAVTVTNPCKASELPQEASGQKFIQNALLR